MRPNCVCFGCEQEARRISGLNSSPSGVAEPQHHADTPSSPPTVGAAMAIIFSAFIVPAPVFDAKGVLVEPKRDDPRLQVDMGGGAMVHAVLDAPNFTTWPFELQVILSRSTTAPWHAFCSTTPHSPPQLRGSVDHGSSLTRVLVCAATALSLCRVV